MERLRTRVGQVEDHVWKTRLEIVLESIPPHEGDRLRHEIERVKTRERCTFSFAAGLVLRHTAGMRYEDGANVDRLVTEVIQRGSAVNILLTYRRK